MRTPRLTLLALLTAAIWIAVPNAYADRGEGTGTGVGGGGDDVELDFVRHGNQAMRALDEVADKVPYVDMMKLFAIWDTPCDPAGKPESCSTILATDDALYDSQGNEKAAINEPTQKLIRVNRARWRAIQTAPLRKALALHEILGLGRYEKSGDYRISAWVFKIAPGELANGSRIGSIRTDVKYQISEGAQQTDRFKFETDLAKNQVVVTHTYKGTYVDAQTQTYALEARGDDLWAGSYAGPSPHEVNVPYQAFYLFWMKVLPNGKILAAKCEKRDLGELAAVQAGADHSTFPCSGAMLRLEPAASIKSRLTSIKNGTNFRRVDDYSARPHWIHAETDLATDKLILTYSNRPTEILSRMTLNNPTVQAWGWESGPGSFLKVTILPDGDLVIERAWVTQTFWSSIDLADPDYSSESVKWTPIRTRK